MIVSEYFKTPIWIDEKTEWLEDMIKTTDPYIKKAKKLNKQKIEENNNSDFGIVHHSENLFPEKKLKYFIDYIGEKSYEFLDWMGYDLSKYQLAMTELWVQEFPKDGGGHHHAHYHPNNHVTGFYYLKCTNESSFPIFNDPRVAHLVTQLPEKDNTQITHANYAVHWKVKPGTLIFTPAYLAHEYVVQKGDPFRFIHFNIQAIRRQNNA